LKVLHLVISDTSVCLANVLANRSNS